VEISSLLCGCAGVPGVGRLVWHTANIAILCISLDRRAIENNGIQGAISKSENWQGWEGKGGLFLRLADRYV
jgi:hypothetical protein